jgi:hypothetical protein
MIATKPKPIENERHKIDFFLLHSVNTLAMLPTLVHHDWISPANAIRLQEWTGRCHLLNYVSQVAPRLTLEELDGYVSSRSWDEAFRYSILHPSDDGHLAKCIRSLAFGSQLLSEKSGSNGLRMKPDSWLQLANLGEALGSSEEFRMLTEVPVSDTVLWEAKSSPDRWLLAFDDLKH